MKTIYLTNGGETTVDDEDYDYLMKWNWQSNDQGVLRSSHENEVQETIFMHRVIAERRGLKINGLQIDHIDRNPFNNQFINLRIATNSQNQMNKEKIKNNTSGYKCVSWVERNQKWQATITKDRKQYFLGYFEDPRIAAKEYDRAAKLLHGEFACLNFPENKE